MYLKDFCALIISGITLHDGLISKNGMVAVYGRGNYIRTLHTDQIISSTMELKSLLQNDFNIKTKSFFFTEGPFSAQICVLKKDGSSDLENYLKNFGFKSSDHTDERIAADKYLNQFKANEHSSRIKDFPPYRIDYIPSMGRELASAITLGEVGITGDFNCLSPRGEQAPYYLSLTSPLDIGELNIKASVKSGDIHKKMVYINGKLRILKMRVDSEILNKPLKMELNPKLDKTYDEGEMLRESFEKFCQTYYNRHHFITSMDTVEHIVLGCPRRRKID